ncbi:MAG: hypothetical protein IPJ45_07370 [Ignavibacteria bacterium]|nr:hypothetical protein [Ignavibacteria bacterium]
MIKEFSLDVYANYEYKIGLCRNNRKYIDNSIEIKNDFENVNIIHKKCLNDHLNRNSNGYLSLSSINPKQIELIKYKTIKQTWESIMSEYKKIS